MNSNKLNSLLQKSPYILISVALSMIVSLAILLSSFYIHEYGHASYAIIYSMVEKSSSLNITFNYQNLFGIMMPQGTKVVLSVNRYFALGYGVSGVLFTTLFYLTLSTTTSHRSPIFEAGSL